MSKESWKKEFYPQPACEVKTYLGALFNSINKWSGLSKKNLQKHGLVRRHKTIYDPHAKGAKVLEISKTSCAMCQYFLKPDGTLDCPRCPLGYRSPKGDCSLVIRQFSKSGRVGPMVKRLENAFFKVKESCFYKG